MGREFRTLVRVRLDVLDDTAAVGAKDSGTPAVGAKSSHWASPAVIKEAKDFTIIPAVGPRSHLQCMAGAVRLKWKRECAIRD